MKNTYLIVAILLISIRSYSQPLPVKKWGVIVGDNISTYKVVPETQRVSNISVGLFARFPFAKRFSIDPRLFIRYTGGASVLTVSAPDQYPKNLFDTTTVQRTTSYVSILIPVSYQISKRLSFSFGPQFMIQTGSNDKFKSRIGTDQLNVDSENIMHKYDAGVTAGIAFERFITIGVQYYYGLMYVLKTDNSQATNSIIQIWVGIPFKGRERSDS